MKKKCSRQKVEIFQSRRAQFEKKVNHYTGARHSRVEPIKFLLLEVSRISKKLLFQLFYV